MGPDGNAGPDSIATPLIVMLEDLTMVYCWSLSVNGSIVISVSLEFKSPPSASNRSSQIPESGNYLCHLFILLLNFDNKENTTAFQSYQQFLNFEEVSVLLRVNYLKFLSNHGKSKREIVFNIEELRLRDS